MTAFRIFSTRREAREAAKARPTARVVNVGPNQWMVVAQVVVALREDGSWE